jgi:hypothetical protein
MDVTAFCGERVLVEQRASALGQSDTEGQVLDSRSHSLLMWTSSLEQKIPRLHPPATQGTLACVSKAVEFAGRRHARLDWSPACFDRWFAAVRCGQRLPNSSLGSTSVTRARIPLCAGSFPVRSC